MNIGLIIYSQTGNTNIVAKKLLEKLSAAGHAAEIVHIKAEGPVRPRMKDIELQSLPSVEPYDAVVFASPVQGFALSSVMAAYLSQLDRLTDKKVALLVTQFFPFPFMGGNQAMDSMRQICEDKGANISSTEIINWSRRSRDLAINDCVARMSDSLLATA